MNMMDELSENRAPLHYHLSDSIPSIHDSSILTWNFYFLFLTRRMKVMSTAALLHLISVVSFVNGAAIAAIGSSAGNSLMIANSRTARQESVPSNDVSEMNNEPVFRTQPGFPAVFQPAASNDYQLKTSGAFSIMDSGVVFWGIAGVLGLAAALWITSLFTGLGFLKTVLAGFHSFKGRADAMGFKLDNQQLNVVANQVYKAIEAWRIKNQ